MGDRREVEDLAALSVDALIDLCDHGILEACDELDRRGVEPPIIEPDAPPVPVVAP